MMTFYKFDNFYFYSTHLLQTRFFYRSKKFHSPFLPKIFKKPLLSVSLKLSVKWSQRNIYFVWDLLRTVFYFQQYFLKNPHITLNNKKYVSLEMKFFSNEVEFKNFLNYIANFKSIRPKLITKNYLTKQNFYVLNFHESQFQITLPKTTIFDFYNWKNKVPIIFSPSFIHQEKNSKIQIQLIRFYYIQLYKQLFRYRNLKLQTLIKNALFVPPFCKTF
jgi:hypothetical protein